MPRRTALIVPVPGASAHYDGPAGVPAHVTVLFPFADEGAVDEPALEELFAAFAPFDFALDEVRRFPDGLTWLHPEPSEPFRALTEAVWRRWPEHPPYEGVHDEVVPHVTITSDEVELPIAARAHEVWLLVEEDERRFAFRRAFALGQGVA